MNPKTLCYLFVAILVASSHAATTLQDGDTVQGLVGYRQMDVYTFTLTPNHASVKFTVTPVSGDPDLYLKKGTTDVTITNKDLVSRVFGGDRIILRRGDALFQDGATYSIGVYGYTQANYTLSAATSLAITTLYVGVPARGEIDLQGDYQYFKVTPTHWANLNFTVTITEFTGSVDVYGSTTNTRPNATDFHPGWVATDESEFTIPTDAFCHNSNTACTLYIGVRATQPSATFSVLVNSQHGVSTLIDGEPQAGYVEYGKYAQYSIHLGSSHEDLSFVLSPRWGIGYLYLGTESPVTAQNALAKAESYGAQRLTLRHTQSPFCTDCTLYLAVYGRTHTHYSLTARTTNATVFLQAGQAFRETLDRIGETEYFMVYIGRNDVNVTISATVYSGQVDIYVTTSRYPLPVSTHPNEQTAVWSRVGNTNGYNSSLTIGNSDPHFCSYCYYYIGVRAVQATDMSLLVSYDLLPTVLVDGSPQNDIVQYHDAKYYTFTPQSADEDVTLTVTRRFGDPDMYIDTVPYPTRARHKWHASSFGSDSKFIPHTDPLYQGQTLWIMVYGYSHAHYSILAHSASSISQITLGSPQNGQIDTVGQYAYYKVYVNHGNINLTVTVTTFSGDVDLYVSHNDTRPNANSNPSLVWSSTGSVNDSISVPVDDINRVQPAYYYIGVRAVQPCSYSILAASSAVPVRLNEGEPQAGSVHYHEYTYYVFELTGKHYDTTITVTPRSGDPDLYVSTHPDMLPTKERHSFHATRFGKDSLLIRGSYLSCPDSGPCSIIIGVYGYTQSQFTVTAATQHSVIYLRAGTPTYDQIDTVNDYAYFMALQPERNANVSVVLTTTSGAVRAFVGVGSTMQRPSAQSYNWTSDASGEVAIPAGDPKQCTAPCYYYIAVQGVTPATFSILYTYQGVPVPLVDGEPQNLIVNKGAWKYYSFDIVPGYKDLQITVVPKWGDPDLYVAIAPQLPTLTNHIKYSRGYSRDTVQFLHNELTANSYIIGVYGYSHSHAVITAATDGVTVNLQIGTPYSGYIDTAGGYEYFRIYNNEADTNITFSVTVQSGDVDMYVAKDYEQPNATHHQWPNAAHPGNNKYSFSITNTDDGYCRFCSYYIGIRGAQPSRFTLLVSQSNVPSILVNGKQSYGSVRAEAYHYYTVSFGNAAVQQVSISLQPFYGKSDIYVNTAAKGLPSVTSSQWNSSRAYGTDNVHINTAKADDKAKWCPPTEDFCKLFVAVYGETNSFYRISSTTEHAPIQLTSGSATRDSVPEDAYAYFQLQVNGRPDANITIDVTTLSGRTSIVASTTRSSPTMDDDQNSWKASSHMVIKPTDKDFVGTGSYYIGVYGYSYSEFSIVATLDDQEVTIFSGVPQQGSVEPGLYRYYKFTVDHGQDMSISITPSVGTTDMYIATAEYTTRPTKDKFQWYSTHSQFAVGESKIIEAHDPQYCQDSSKPCEFHVAVLGVSESTFSIQGSSAGSMSVLAEGKKVAGSVKKGEYARYEFFGNNTAPSKVSIFALPCVGDVEVFVSKTVLEPTKEQHDTVAGDPYRKSFTDQGKVYYVGVYGKENSQFQIRGSLDTAELIPGDNGDLVLSGVTTDQATVLFTRLDPSQDDGTRPVLYEVYVQELSSASLRFDTPCALNRNGRKSGSIDPVAQKISGRQLVHTVTSLKKNTRYRVNVVAILDGQQDRAYSYSEFQTLITNNPNTIAGLTPEELLGILLGCFGFILIVAVGYYYYRRRNGARPSLSLAPMHEEASDLLFHAYAPEDEEQEDGDEGGASSGVQQGNKPRGMFRNKDQRYSKLDEDVDDELDDDEDLEDYAPPVAV